MRWYLLAFVMLLVLGAVVQLHLYRSAQRAHESVREQVAEGILPVARRQIDELNAVVDSLRGEISSLTNRVEQLEQGDG